MNLITNSRREFRIRRIPKSRISFHNLPIEIITYILSFTHIPDLLNMQVNKYLKNIIRSYSWNHCIGSEDNHIIEFFTDNFNFNSYIVYNTKIKNYKRFTNCKSLCCDSNIKTLDLKYLSNCKKIVLDDSSIKSSGLKYLSKCSYISLKNCPYIKDNELKYLDSCKEINLSRTNITGSGLKYLSCESINLSNCEFLTNKGIKNLNPSCKVLNIESCVYVNNFTYFTHLTQINVSALHIKDSDLKYLKNCISMNLADCPLLTRNCVKYLTHCKKLNLTYSKIIDEDLKYLKNCENLNLTCCEINGSGLKYLNCKKLEISNCLILRENLKYLSKCETLKIYDLKFKDSDLHYFQNCYCLYLGMNNITNSGLNHLSKVKKLYFENMNINSGLKYLISCKEITLTNCKIRIKYLRHLRCDKIEIIDCGKKKINKKKLRKLKCNTINYYDSDTIFTNKGSIRYNGIKACKD